MLCRAPCSLSHVLPFKDGSLSGAFAFGGAQVQKDMLLKEGVKFKEEFKVDMSECLWEG